MPQEGAGHVGLDVRTEVMRSAKEGKAHALFQYVTTQAMVDTRMLGKALHMAVQGNHLECCEILLNSGADVDEKNSSGNTCMHLTAMSGSLETMKLLMDSQASLNIRNADGKCAIALAKNPETRKLISAEVNRRAEAKERRRRFAAEVQARNASSETGCRSPLVPRNGQQKASATSDQKAVKDKPASQKTEEPVSQQSQDLGEAVSVDYTKQTELLMCMVCLRDFCSEARTEPVCLPCGHTFCSTCIECLRGTDKLGSTAHSFRCPLDRQVFSRNLELKVNTLLKEIIPLIRASVGVHSYPPREPEVQQAAHLDASVLPMPQPPNFERIPCVHIIPTRDAAVSPMTPSQPPMMEISCSPLVSLSAMLRQGKPSPGSGLMNAALQTLTCHLSPVSRAMANSMQSLSPTEVRVLKATSQAHDTEDVRVANRRQIEQVVQELVDAACLSR